MDVNVVVRETAAAATRAAIGQGARYRAGRAPGSPVGRPSAQGAARTRAAAPWLFPPRKGAYRCASSVGP